MISPEVLEQIADAAASYANLDEAALAALKKLWPALRFTLCSDEDMPARLPSTLQREKFNLYMVGGEHCLGLVTDPQQALGVVLATVD